MHEVLIASGIAAAPLLLVLIGSRAPIEMLWLIGAVLLLLGLGVGVPAGACYHVLLGRELSRCGQRQPRFWLNPTSFHAHLPANGRGRVLRWFYAGAAGFVLSLVGCVALFLAALRL